MFIVILSSFGNTSRFFSAQNVLQYILDGTIQKAQTCVFYHMTNYDSIFIRSWIIPVFMEGNLLVPFPAVNAQTQGKITYNIP
jgi:hypothetical protein